MQYFSEVDRMEDYFDRGNFFTYLYSNALRAQIASTTSCGTNAVWAMRDHYDGTPFVFKGETKIEDTETSHHCFTYGEDSHYIAEKLVYGAVKQPVEYGEAPSRWAAGALQLLGVEVRRSPWILLSIVGIYFVTPFTLSFLVFFVERCHFIIAALEVVVLASLFGIVPFLGHLARYLIRVVNVTYWLQGPFLAMYWMNILPILLLVSPTFPVKVDVVFMVMGSCLILFLQWVVMTITKGWCGAKEIHIWRNQQVWYSLWPLMFAGIPLLCIGGKMWSISSNQSIFTFVINLLQIISICVASIYAVHDISSKVQVNQNQIQFQDMSICGSRIMGLMFAILSLALILPITISLLFMICGSKNSHGIRFSMRHLQLTFLIIVLFSVSYMVGINWQNVIYNLGQKYALGFPIFTLPK